MLNNLYSILNYSQVAISLQGCLATAVSVESQEKVMMHIKIYNKELLKIMSIFIYSKYFLFGHFNAFKIKGENESNQWELQNVCEMIIIIFFFFFYSCSTFQERRSKHFTTISTFSLTEACGIRRW